MSAAEVKKYVARDTVAREKRRVRRDGPSRTFLTYGPKTRREFLKAFGSPGLTAHSRAIRRGDRAGQAKEERHEHDTGSDRWIGMFAAGAAEGDRPGEGRERPGSAPG